MQKDFDAWNEQKKSIEAGTNKKAGFPQAGEVWMCTIGQNVGFEQNGGGDTFSRPVLVEPISKITAQNKMKSCLAIQTPGFRLQKAHRSSTIPVSSSRTSLFSLGI